MKTVQGADILCTLKVTDVNRVELGSAQDEHAKLPAGRVEREQESRESGRPVTGVAERSPTKTTISIRVTMRHPRRSSLNESELDCRSEVAGAGKMNPALVPRPPDGPCLKRSHSRKSGNAVDWEPCIPQHQANVCLPPIRSTSLPLPPPVAHLLAEGSRSLPTLGFPDLHPRSLTHQPNMPVQLRRPSTPKKCFSHLPQIPSQTYAEDKPSATRIRTFSDTTEDRVTNRSSGEFASPRKNHLQEEEVNVRRYKTLPSFSQTHHPRLWSILPASVQHTRHTVTQALLPRIDFGVCATARRRNHWKGFESRHDDDEKKTTPKCTDVDCSASNNNTCTTPAVDAQHHVSLLNKDTQKVCLASSAVNEFVPTAQVLKNSSKAITPVTEHKDTETLAEPHDPSLRENVQHSEPNDSLKKNAVTVEDMHKVYKRYQILYPLNKEAETELVQTELNPSVKLGVNSAVPAEFKVDEVEHRTCLSPRTENVKDTVINSSMPVGNGSQCQPACIPPALMEDTADKSKHASYKAADFCHLLATPGPTVPGEQSLLSKNMLKDSTPPLQCSCQKCCPPIEASEMKQDEREAGVTSEGNFRDSVLAAEQEEAGAKMPQKPLSSAEVVGNGARPGKQRGVNREVMHSPRITRIRVWETEMEEPLVKNIADVMASSKKNVPRRKGLRKTNRTVSSGVIAEKAHIKKSANRLRTTIKSPYPSSPQHGRISPNILGIQMEGVSRKTQTTKCPSAKKHSARHCAVQLKLPDEDAKMVFHSRKTHSFSEKCGPLSKSGVDFSQLNYDDLFSESTRKDVQTPAIWQMFTGAVYLARRQTKPLLGPVQSPRSVSARKPKTPASVRPRGRHVKLHGNDGGIKKAKPKSACPSRLEISSVRSQQTHARSKSVNTNAEKNRKSKHEKESLREKSPAVQGAPLHDIPQPLSTLKEDTLENCTNEFKHMALQLHKREPLIEKPDSRTSVSQGVADAASVSNDVAQDPTITWIKGNRLGKGAFGTVFLGLTNQGKLIAVKELELKDSQSANANQSGQKRSELQKLQDEVELLTTLHHPNVVEYLGTELDGNRFSIFMEFVPGGTVAETVRSFGPLGESVCRSYIAQMACGLAYLHGRGVMHGDVKGSNAVITPAGVVKLIDFGCAQRVALALSCRENGALHSVHGTAYWMAPEVINGTGYGRRADVWSLGCTLHEMAVGRPPFADMAPMAALLHIGVRRRIMPDLPQAFSQEAQEFVEQCFIRNKLKRPSSQELLSHPFICEEPCAQ